jgi:hypothetical protein
MDIGKQEIATLQKYLLHLGKKIEIIAQKPT